MLSNLEPRSCCIKCHIGTRTKLTVSLDGSKSSSCCQWLGSWWWHLVVGRLGDWSRWMLLLLLKMMWHRRRKRRLRSRCSLDVIRLYHWIGSSSSSSKLWCHVPMWDKNDSLGIYNLLATSIGGISFPLGWYKHWWWLWGGWKWTSPKIRFIHTRGFKVNKGWSPRVVSMD